MSTTKRLFLVIFVSTFQLLLMLVGVTALFSWYGNTAEEFALRQINQTNDSLVAHACREIRQMELGDIRNTRREWQRLQYYVERTADAQHPFIAILDRDTGHFICHPHLRQRPELGETSCRIPLADQSTENGKNGLPLVSTMQLEGDNYVVSGRQLPELNVIVASFHPYDHIMVWRNWLIHPVGRITFAVTLAIGFLGIVTSMFVLAQVERKFADKRRILERAIESRTMELMRTKNAVIVGLAKLAESRDNDTGEHLERIRKYVTILARELSKSHPEIDEEFIRNLALASSLHDVGKVGIPDSILLKPGRLTPEERMIMELHTIIGGDCLEAIGLRLGESDFLDMARQVAYWHHERWDGTGYPHGLKGEEIPLVARIVSVADVYDALTSRRPYKMAMDHEKSRSIIVSGSGTQFDPQVVEAFLAHEDEFRAVAAEQDLLSEDELVSQIDRRKQQLQALMEQAESCV